MNAKNRFLPASILGLILFTLFGCSETTKQADPLPELISTAYFPYIKENSIFTFNPESGTSELLARSETGLIVALDTDISKVEIIDNENSEGTEVLTHTATAEYITYANKQTLHLIDLNTRYDHDIFSFKENKKFDQDSQSLIDAEESYICDIQKSIFWDEDSRLDNQILFKDELKIFVKTSPQEDCANTDESAFSFWQINIEETDSTYTKRRLILTEHTHKHTHQHDHNDPDHKHEHSDDLIEREEEDGGTFDPLNHEHEHTHTHDFVYGDDHFHDFLTKDEVDAVHNAPIDNDFKTYQEVQFETHPILKGQKSTIESIDESLMYSGSPIVDIRNRTFGYLGLNSATNTYKFYNIDLDNLKRSLLWELSDDNFTNTNESILALSDFEKIAPKFNRLSNFKYINDDILLQSNNKLFYFTLTELFDDDESEARNISISNPVYISSLDEDPLEDRIKYNSELQKMAIVENMDIWQIDFSDGRPSDNQLIKRYTETDLIKISASFIGDELFIEKHFDNAGIPETSITSLQTSGLENQTLIERTLDRITSQKRDTDILITRLDNFSQTLSTSHYATSFNSPFITNLDESLWTLESIDYRDYTEKNIITLLKSNLTPFLADSIEAPRLFIFDKINDDDNGSIENGFGDSVDGIGEDFGFVPQEIKGASKAVIFNDLYGFLEVENTDNSTSTYFFTNEKSSFNFDNEFKEMKLLDPDNTDETSETSE